MLTESLVLDFIKKNLGHPVMQLEISDDEILEYVRNYTLPFFSRFKPYQQYVVIDLEKNPEYKIDDTTFRIPLDPNHKFISIVNVLNTLGDYFINSYPYNPYPTWNALPDYLLSMTKSLTQMKYSVFNFTWKYFPPDKLQILPKLDRSYYTVLGAFVHTFDTIPTDWERHFLDLALADICDYIASLRVKFQNYTTPYGDINLNWDYFQNKAENLRNKVLEKLEKTRPLVYCFVR